MNQTFKYNILLEPKRLSGALGLLLLLVLALYVYLINSTFMAVSNRRALEEKLATAQSTLTKLSATYLEAQSTITKDRALALGYVAAPISSEIVTIDHVTERALSFKK